MSQNKPTGEPSSGGPSMRRRLLGPAAALGLSAGAVGVGVTGIATMAYLLPTAMEAAAQEAGRQTAEALNEAKEAAQAFGLAYLDLLRHLAGVVDIEDVKIEAVHLVDDVVAIAMGGTPETSFLADANALVEDLKKIASGDLDDFQAMEQIMVHTARFVDRHSEDAALQAQWKLTKESFDVATAKYDGLKPFIGAALPDASMADRARPFANEEMTTAVWGAVRKKISEDLWEVF